MTGKRRSLLPLILAIVLGLGACTAIEAGKSITVLASWTGTEADSFGLVIKGFEDQTGIKVTYTGTRALSQLLSADVQKGQPPDVAVLPSPGELAGYVRSGQVQAVDGILGDHPEDSYRKQWLDLLRLGTDKLYAIPVKTDLKSIVWYDPATFRGGSPPLAWDQLTAFGDSFRAGGRSPWCVGMGATPVSGWPGTDWIEDILLHQSGSPVYRTWAAGNLAWTSPQVKQAWTTWRQIVTTPGGSMSALLTDFGDAAKPMFADPPGCALEHQGSFNLSAYEHLSRGGKNLVPGQDFAYFPFPPLSGDYDGSLEVSADLAAMFQPSDNAREFMKYLASEPAQRMWPSLGGAFSANNKVLADTANPVYTDEVSKNIARSLTSGHTLCFDASDLMPATMSDAFSLAVLEYLADPASLDSLLGNLEKVRNNIKPEDKLDAACGLENH